MELQAVAGMLRRRWWVFIVGLIVGLVGGVVLTASTPKQYRASARLFVSVPDADNTQLQTLGVQLVTQQLATFAKIASSQKTTKIVSESMANRIPPGQIRAKVSAVPVPQTNLIEVHAKNNRPLIAAELANETADALTIVIDELGANPTGGVKASVIDRAGIPAVPVTPQPKRNLMLGGILGLALGAAGALLIDALDRSIRDASIAGEVFDAPVLCSVPRQRRLSSDPLVALKAGGSSTGEAYRALRTSIRFRDATKPLKTVLVTSAAAGDGKSTIAANLAIAMSLDGARVILIDADLRRTRLGTMFDLPAGPGITEVLLGKSTLDAALVPWSRGLSILQVGNHTLNPSEALGSQAMVQLLEDAKRLADIVIIDAPPVLPVADPSVLAALVDGTLIVCRWGRTSVHAADATRAMLENVGADVVGVVFNAEGGGRAADYYRHYSTRPQHRRVDQPPPTPMDPPRAVDAPQDGNGAQPVEDEAAALPVSESGEIPTT